MAISLNGVVTLNILELFTISSIYFESSYKLNVDKVFNLVSKQYWSDSIRDRMMSAWVGTADWWLT